MDIYEAIGDLWEVMKSYNPEVYGFHWQMKMGPGSLAFTYQLYSAAFGQ